MKPGIDPKLMQCITQKVTELSEIDKYCVLTWDEVALRPHLNYNRSQDIIEGFVEVEMRHPLFATHALTFMVRGINKQYKQPTAFYYTENIASVELAKLIEVVTKAILATGTTDTSYMQYFFICKCYYKVLMLLVQFVIKRL